jgi:hypothetical protein
MMNDELQGLFILEDLAQRLPKLTPDVPHTDE